MEDTATASATQRALRKAAGSAHALLVRAAIAVGWLARGAWRHRSPIVALVVRVAFWGALALWLTTALSVVGATPLPTDEAVLRFAIGAGICAIAVVSAVARHVRWASWALGSLHGASATVLWLLVAA
jgi:hypothetical protein